MSRALPEEARAADAELRAMQGGHIALLRLVDEPPDHGRFAWCVVNRASGHTVAVCGDEGEARRVAGEMDGAGLCCLDGAPLSGRCWSCGHKDDVQPGWEARVNGRSEGTSPPVVADRARRPSSATESNEGVETAHRPPNAARDALDATMSEADWQRQVVAFAEANGWTCWHDHDARRNDSGLPDLLLIRERVIFAELKRQGGRVRPVQRWFHGLLGGAGAEIYVWYPRDWPDVQRVLGSKGE